jgi:gamma-glutamyltranspeptidase / glutathione hydrolase
MFDYFTSLFKPQGSFFQPAEKPTVGRDSIVVAYHPQLREIGHAILDSGGNAFDAFVAVTAAENVLAEGASSLAGPLGVLIYDSSQHQVMCLDADFNDPLDPDWRWEARMPRDGRAVLVPGAPAGLEALAQKYGTRSFSDLLQPAMQLAEEGFTVSKVMAAFISWRAKTLKRTEYGRRTFFSTNGKPLKPGETLRLPEVASFLSKLASNGSSYVYAGDWGKQFLEVVQSKHGVLTSDDLAAYRVRWDAPWTTTYRDYTLYSSSGYAYGGLWTLLALKTLEHTSLPTGSHYSANADALDLLVRIARQVWAESWILDYRVLEDRSLVESRLTPDYTRQIWDRVEKRAPFQGIGTAESHSYHIIIVDKDGNVASGTTTIESEPWGEGIFVEGVPLSIAGAIPFNTAPGRRRISPFSIHFAFHDNRLRFAVGGISNSLVEATFQFLVNLIDYQLPIDHAVSWPRFGTFPAKKILDLKKNWLDPRISNDIVKALKKQGLKFEWKGAIDTGLGCIVAAEPNGMLSGVVAPLPYMADPFGTDL